MNMFRLWRLFHRSGTRGTSGRTSALAIVAFASATAVFLTVLGGLHGFIWRASADHTFGCMIDSNRCAPGTYETWSKTLAHADKLVATVGDGHWTADQATAVMNTYSDGYVLLAAFASLLLIVPFVALAGSAARLAASRRDARLAALRLAGATTAQVTKLTALDAGGQALLGALVGMAGYFALIPAIMLLDFQNQHFTFEQLWVGLPALAAVTVGVTLLALVSALAALRRVAFTPLGVTQRTGQPMPSAWRTDFPCRVGRRLPAAQQHLRIRALGSDGGLRHHLRRLLPRLRHGERRRYLGGGDARQIACETPEGRGHYDCHAPYP